ncbi:MAG: TonB-dependent receptor [Deferribacteres bacterium]|nr:TonB-dependent receptor [Deferribacteres bacterium]
MYIPGKVLKLVFMFALCNTTFAQNKITISGFIRDAGSGEALIGANIAIKGTNKGTASNEYGFYSLSIPEGEFSIIFRYIGYETIEKVVDLSEKYTLNIELQPVAVEGEEIVVTAMQEDKNVKSLEMSVATLDMRAIPKVPVVLGEGDILKSIQLLPGVTTGRENASGFNVRGGATDQNLILLDESPIYNSAHLLGFFSIFNSDAIKDVQLYKGGIPAQYGGRLSSVLDVRQNEGNNKSFHGAGGLGLISSRLLLEGPIQKDRGSFLIAGRRSYGDLLLKAANVLHDNSVYFYDLNFKGNWAIGTKNHFYASGYLGEDKLQMGESFTNAWGNDAVTLRWNHLFSDQLFSNFSGIFSDYQYSLDMFHRGLNWEAHIVNYNLKSDFSWYINDRHQLDFGAGMLYYEFQPGQITPIDDSSVQETILDKKFALEPALYLSNNHKISNKLSMQYGLRFTSFLRLGEQTIYQYENDAPILYNPDLGIHSNGVVVDSTAYLPGDIIKSFLGFEPRFSTRYTLNEQSCVKFSYNRTRQYIHLISNNTSPTPLDMWTPSGPYIEPQIADQFAIGYFRNFDNNVYESSLELYYKSMQNQLDYVDGADLVLNNNLETEILAGEGRAYGAEVYFKKNKGKLTGWLSYTLSRTERRVPGISADDPGINAGEFYPSNYDKTHDLSITFIFELKKGWSLSGNFVYASGTPTTYPASKYEFSGLILPQYEDRNQQRLPAYHRLDIGATMYDKLGGDWVFSIYNVYNRKNAYAVQFEQNPDEPTKTQAVKTYVFGIVPSISYSFQF